MTDTSTDVTPPLPLAPEAGVGELHFSSRWKLSGMMFLQYFTWGLWYVTLGTYAKETRLFSAEEIGLVYGAAPLAAIFSPFFVGMVADRLFATERILATLHLLGAVLLYAASIVSDFGAFYPLLLLYFLCYMPTLALTNSISFHNMSDPARQFPGIRVLGTIGWIAAGNVVGMLAIEKLNTPMQLGAVSSLVLAVYCLCLPHTPPAKRGTRVTIGDVLGLDALKLMRNWPFAVFVIGSFLVCIPLQFYYAWTNVFLNEVNVANPEVQSATFRFLEAIHMTGPASVMTFGQVSEIFFMLVMPVFFIRLGFKYMLLVGMLAWVSRYFLFAFGDPNAGMWMLFLGVLLHGICYDFFFVTGQVYVDKKASIDIRSAAQGFIALVTLGLGGFIGATVSGFVVEHYTQHAVQPGGQATHAWHSIWLVPAIGAAVVTVLFALTFRDREVERSTVELS